MADQTIPDYETIRAAVAGETWAVEKVLMCYKDEIDRQATVKKRQPDGTFKLEIDEDMRQYITMKLIESLPQFPLEEMEREEKRNRNKKSRIGGMSMIRLTVEEMNLLSIYHEGSKAQLMVNMTAALPFMDEDMRPFAELTLQKISPLTENEYAELAIFAADEV